VVRNDDQRGGLGKGRVLRQEARVHVTVRTDERQVAGFLVQGARDASDRRIGIEEAVVFENHV